MSDHRPFARRAAVLCSLLLSIPLGARAQNTAAKKSPPARGQKGGATSPRVSLSPRFIPGETFRYEMEFETTTDTSRSGIASDPQGPSSLAVVWNAKVRIEVLPADAGTPGGIRLRTTYEKSTASVTSDTFDPAASETSEQYHKLEGKVVEFTLDAERKSEIRRRPRGNFRLRKSGAIGARMDRATQRQRGRAARRRFGRANMVLGTAGRYAAHRRTGLAHRLAISSQRVLPPAESRCPNGGGFRREFTNTAGLRRDPRKLEFGALQGGPAIRLLRIFARMECNRRGSGTARRKVCCTYRSPRAWL